ncbi:hypothetical protein TRIATDRAFT_302508 [Trichoderma atroviride IMI 206040]|uniref:Uncharacterized protein n=1 Tax=Hypocrea atroviridis (strain ATCC 20476 / IMI 206040) TaxID=452589 RepID=G9PAF9_HYPAI|nr:uncharacterized protein TRIATDRAFT_302508 [Trichoderma atroviride IMI 206040]EHK39994.1 hypothetical protein TRIATDRAFT_302508 [Trichoderma atroviride IMI 206040]
MGGCKEEKQSAFSNTCWNGGPKGSVRVSIQLFDCDAGKRHHYILRGFAEPSHRVSHMPRRDSDRAASDANGIRSRQPDS